VACIEEETMLGKEGVVLRHYVHVVHRPSAARGQQCRRDELGWPARRVTSPVEPEPARSRATPHPSRRRTSFSSPRLPAAPPGAGPDGHSLEWPPGGKERLPDRQHPRPPQRAGRQPLQSRPPPDPRPPSSAPT
jgi:hypothetical protein